MQSPITNQRFSAQPNKIIFIVALLCSFSGTVVLAARGADGALSMFPRHLSPLVQPGGSPPGFVTREGTLLYTDSTPFRIVGLNLFDAAGTGDGYHCASWGTYSA